MRSVLSSLVVMFAASFGFAQCPNCPNGRCPMPSTPAVKQVVKWAHREYGYLAETSYGWVAYDPRNGKANVWDGYRWGGWQDMPAGLSAPSCICGDGCKCTPGNCPAKCPVSKRPHLLDVMRETQFGVNGEELEQSKYHYNGTPVERDVAISKIQDNIPSLANKWRVVVVGNEDFRKAALAKIGTPDTAAINAYDPDSWVVAALGLEAGSVYFLRPDGEQVAKVENTGDELAAAVAVTQTTPDKFAPAPPKPVDPPKPLAPDAPAPAPKPDNGNDLVIRIPNVDSITPSSGNAWGAGLGSVLTLLAARMIRRRFAPAATPQPPSVPAKPIAPPAPSTKGW